MTYHRVIVEPTGYRVGLTTDGRDFEARGPAWKAPREAIDYALALDQMPFVSPLRVPVMGSALVPSAPLSGAGKPSPSQVAGTATSRSSKRTPGE